MTGFVRVFTHVYVVVQFMWWELSAFLEANPSIQVQREKKASAAVRQAVTDDIEDTDPRLPP